MTTVLNKTCKLASYGYDQRHNGACCWIKDADGNSFSRSKTTAKKYLHSAFIKEVRQALENGIEHPACEKCWVDESQGKISKRIGTEKNDYINWHANSGDLVYLTLFVGNKCNLACRTCGSHSSTGWFKEHKTIQAESNKQQPGFEYGINLKPFDASDIDVPLDKLQFLEVLGGEPFYELEHVKFIERICREADPKNVSLFYSTNGTKTIDPDIEKMFNKFKKIIISFSIDAVYKPFEYIRTLGKWDQVEETISYWRSQPNVQLQNHATMSVLNIMYITDLYNYFKEKQNFADWQLSYTYAEYPPQYNYNVMREDIKEKYYNDILSSIQFGLHTESIQNYFSNSKFNQQSYDFFLKQLEYTSTIRKLDIHDYLPKLCEVLEL